jgi:hypothetical protein
MQLSESLYSALFQNQMSTTTTLQAEANCLQITFDLESSEMDFKVKCIDEVVKKKSQSSTQNGVKRIFHNLFDIHHSINIQLTNTVFS